MRSIRTVLFLSILAAWAPLAHSLTVTFNPPEPRAGEAFDLQVSGLWRDSCVPGEPRLHIIDRTIHLAYRLVDSGCLSAVSEFASFIRIPPLAAGKYDLRARLFDFDGPIEFFTGQVTVTGTPAGIESISHSFDSSAGNRVVILRGNFACSTAPCATPQVTFGGLPAEGVEKISDHEIHAVAPARTNVRTVDVTVRGDGYSYVLPSGFTYVSLSEYERILIPIFTSRPVPGAFGSLWKSELQIVNRTRLSLDPTIDIFPLEPRCDSEVCVAPLAPMKMLSPRFATPRLDVIDPPVLQFYVRSDLAPYLAFTLRIRDLSRQSESWGTDVPVVRERDLRTSLTLVDVPLQPRFRQMLRVLMPDYVGCCAAHAIFFSAEGNVLAEREVRAGRPNGSIGGLVPAPYLREGSREFPLQPAYAEIDLRSIPELAGHETVWLIIESASPPSRVWAFVSVTNDETQQVTLITPK